MREIQVTQYEAKDGTVFADRAKCERYERDCDALAPIFNKLGTLRPDANGKNYVQHHGITGKTIWDAISATPNAPGPRDCEDPWYRAYWLADCIDYRGREWGQPYFANHPNYMATELK